jgi:hypothetical protein
MGPGAGRKLVFTVKEVMREGSVFGGGGEPAKTLVEPIVELGLKIVTPGAKTNTRTPTPDQLPFAQLILKSYVPGMVRVYSRVPVFGIFPA